MDETPFLTIKLGIVVQAVVQLVTQLMEKIVRTMVMYFEKPGNVPKVFRPNKNFQVPLSKVGSMTTAIM